MYDEQEYPTSVGTSNDRSFRLGPEASAKVLQHGLQNTMNFREKAENLKSY
jgi:hypothetical protein